MYNDTAHQKAHLTFSVFKTTDKKVIKKFMRFNDQINQHLNFPQDNVLAINLPTQPTYLFVVMNSLNKPFAKTFNDFTQTMQSYAITGFPTPKQIQTIQKYLTNQNNKPEDIETNTINIINQFMNWMFGQYLEHGIIQIESLPKANQPVALQMTQPVNGVTKTYQLKAYVKRGTFDTNLNNPHSLEQLFKFITDMDSHQELNPNSDQFKQMVKETNNNLNQTPKTAKAGITFLIGAIILGLIAWCVTQIL